MNVGSYGFNAPKDTKVTLTDEAYVEIGEIIAKQIDELRDSSVGWSPTTHGDDNTAVYTRKNNLPEAKESMLLLVTELAAPAWVIERLVAPWFEYRQRWDDLLEDANVLATLPNETYIVHHVIKKRITLSVRESVDLVHVHRAGNRAIFATCGTSHASTPASRSCTRTHQYIGGYVIEAVNDTTTKFSIIFNADLNLPGPRILANIADRFKPKLMLENARALRQGIKKFMDEIIAEPKVKTLN